MKSITNYRGLFVGLVTLDLVYLTSSIPSNNEKIVASDYIVAAGGPATNAAVTFSRMGQATLLGLVGAHSITGLIREDLSNYNVALVDLDSNRILPPPVSSIIVTQNTGERAVVSINATHCQVDSATIPDQVLHQIDIVLIDGHQMAVGQRIAQAARARQIPVVIDGGSWKPGFEQVLPFVDYAICSANFFPPGCRSSEEVFQYLTDFKIPHIAITFGEEPIQYFWSGIAGTIEVTPLQAVDTLGAGDIFHGAFCYYILRENFITALAAAAKVASYSCQFFGTRSWLQGNVNKSHGMR